ncbi:hypothetical protein GF327_07750 [Candidatus Woesearchaeota archaeon]|nr:hypothetical protein [Candidatus Woesearchaeota archaeon]
MNFFKAFDKLKQSPEYKEWRKQNPDYYLCHGFFMTGQVWELGFYDPNKDRITTFSVGDKITKTSDSEVFKKNKKVKKLDTSKINLNFSEAKDISMNLQKTKYPAHAALKKIFIIQNINDEAVWNITFVTKSFKTLNIKINANTKDIICDSFVSLFQFDNPEK